MFYAALQLVSVFLAGLLAGEEFVIRFGVRAPVAVLAQQPQLELRQALIRRLRLLVPSIFGPTAASGIAVVVLGGVAGPAFTLRLAGVLALLAFILVTLLGTVPINKGMLDWAVDAPPADWRKTIRRWEQFDSVRCWAAVIAFAFFLAALRLELVGR